MNEAILTIYGRPNYRPVKKRPFGKQTQARLSFVIANPQNLDQLWIVRAVDEEAEQWSYLRENDIVVVTPDREIKKKVSINILMNDLFLKVTGRLLRIEKIELVDFEAVDAELEADTASKQKTDEPA